MTFTKRALLGLAFVAGAAQADVLTNIYSHYTPAGGGAPFSGLVGTLHTPGISFATDTGYNWHPFGLGEFGAEIFTDLNVVADGTYNFHLSSDDGALVFVDGSLLIDRGGPHGPSVSDGTVALTAGTHALHIQFFECCGGPSGLDFNIPLGTSVGSTVPEPLSLGLVGLALAGVWVSRRRTA